MTIPAAYALLKLAVFGKTAQAPACMPTGPSHYYISYVVPSINKIIEIASNAFNSIEYIKISFENSNAAST